MNKNLLLEVLSALKNALEVTRSSAARCTSEDAYTLSIVKTELENAIDEVQIALLVDDR